MTRAWSGALCVVTFVVAVTADASATTTVADLTPAVSMTVQGKLGETEEQALLGRLAEVSVAVAERYDEWVRTGAADVRKTTNTLARALLVQLERLHDYHQSRVDKATNDIIAADGNPEILYEQHGWLVDRGFALASCGQLAWLYYRLAMLNPDEKTARTPWLEKSVACFSEFVYGDDPDARDENLLGRALAERELGQLEAAAGDLAVVLQRGPSSPLYWPARLALAETKAAAQTDGGLAETQKLLAESSTATLPTDIRNQIRMLRFQILVAALKKGAPVSLTQEAATLARELTQLGPSWSRRVQQTALAGLPDPRSVLGSSASTEWMAAENLASEEKYEQAIPAYESVRASAPPDSEQATLVLHRLGVCYFRAGRFSDAERALRAYLDRAPSSALAAEAAYLRFRAAEGVFRATPSAETQELFASAAEAYAEGWPQDSNAYEAAFRLGELRQNTGRFLEAADWYARVKGTPAFEIRAAAGEIQSLADVLLHPPPDAGDAWAAPLRARVAAAWATFTKLCAKEQALASEELRARTTLAHAMADAGGPGARLQETLATLDGFEARFPTSADLGPMVAALRLAARAVTGPVAEAEKAAQALLASNDPRTLELLDRAAPILLRNAVETAGSDQTESDRWMAIAAAGFDRLRAAGRTVPADARSALAQYYTTSGRLDDAAAAYAALVKESPQSKTVLRNAASVAVRRAAWLEAADYWTRLAKLQELASPGWYDARLQAAETLEKAGRATEACAAARDVDAFRPDLRDAETKKRFQDLTGRACGE